MSNENTSFKQHNTIDDNDASIEIAAQNILDSDNNIIMALKRVTWPQVNIIFIVYFTLVNNMQNVLNPLWIKC